MQTPKSSKAKHTHKLAPSANGKMGKATLDVTKSTTTELPKTNSLDMPTSYDAPNLIVDNKNLVAPLATDATIARKSSSSEARQIRLENKIRQFKIRFAITMLVGVLMYGTSFGVAYYVSWYIYNVLGEGEREQPPKITSLAFYP